MTWDTPASRYLRAFRLIPARPRFRPAALRHLLTHTAGVRAVRNPSDLLRPVLGWGVPTGRPVPLLAEYYRDGLRIDTEPGTKWAYSNHGFAALGRGRRGRHRNPAQPLPARARVRPALHGTLRPAPVRAGAAPPGHRIPAQLPRAQGGHRPRGACRARAGAVYSTTSDMARYAAALLGGAGEHRRVLQPGTLATMFAPHYQPDPRIPGMGLGFFRGHAGEHQTVGHDGIWTGFHSALLLAPGQRTGVVAFASTAPFGPLATPGPVAHAVLRSLLDLPDDAVRADVPDLPAAWSDLCGWYSLGPGVLTDPQPRMLGPIQVTVHHGQLVVRGQIPVPAIRRGLRLYPDGDDPDAFRIELPGFGSGTSQVVFSRGPAGDVTAMHPRSSAADLPQAAQHPPPHPPGGWRARGRHRGTRHGPQAPLRARGLAEQTIRYRARTIGHGTH